VGKVRVDSAPAGGAAGVHLRADSMSPGAVRTLAPPGFIIGRSVHTVEEALAATAADYLVAGTVWATPSKPAGPLLGIAGFAAIAHAVGIPTLGIGGGTGRRAGALAGAGGAGAAGPGPFRRPESHGCPAASLRTARSLS